VTTSCFVANFATASEEKVMKQELLSNVALRPARHRQSMGETSCEPHQVDRMLSEPTVCSGCGAVFLEGKWQWMSAPIDASLTRCPACLRIHQKMPAGYVTMQGNFANDHRNEMLSLVHHIETREKINHPLKRIMWIEYQEEGVTITTTDIQLTRTIGEALHRAYKGDLDYHFNDSEQLLCALWKR
jgi:hypothetical protein